VQPEPERRRRVDHDHVDVGRDAADQRLAGVLRDLVPLGRPDVLLVVRSSPDPGTTSRSGWKGDGVIACPAGRGSHRTSRMVA
jgi:hypothetical protein